MLFIVRSIQARNEDVGRCPGGVLGARRFKLWELWKADALAVGAAIHSAGLAVPVELRKGRGVQGSDRFGRRAVLGWPGCGGHGVGARRLCVRLQCR